MIKLRQLAGVAIAAIALCACEEDTALSIGSSLTNESDKLIIDTLTFQVSTRTVVTDSVLSLSNNCYFGRVTDPETNTNVTSEFTTQFNVLENNTLLPADSVVSRWTRDGETTSMAAATSCDIIMYPESPFRSNDSLISMKMQLMELSRPLEEGERYYSNYDPVQYGLIREGGMNFGKMFTYRNLMDTDSLKSTSNYLDNIVISLNDKYTDKDGKEYNNYGTYIMQQYYQHPEYFSSSYRFAHKVCPGFFFKIVDGLGFHAMISNIGLRIHYKATVDDSLYNAILVMAGTKEAVQTTHVINDKNAIQQLANRDDCTFLKSPAGLFTEVNLPVEAIRNGHLTDSLLSAKIVFQRINNNSTNSRVLSAPSYLLMVQKDSLTNFFEKNELPDSKTSFYTSFNSKTNTYVFSNISSLISRLYQNKHELMEREHKTEAEWEAEHPNWNKVLLVPVTINTNSSTGAVTSCEHNMSLSSTKLVGGKYSPIDMKVIYAKFKE